jgi:hypothetical protein
MFISCFAVACVLLSTPAFATPEFGTIDGRVFADSTGTLGGYAEVSVAGTRRGAQAEEDGKFRITEVPPGLWTLRVRLLGFKPLEVPVEVIAGDTLEDLELVLPPRFVPPPADIGARSKVRSDELIATIRPASTHFRVGDNPKFDVRIKNEGTSPALLVTSVDASDAWASPGVRIDIKGPVGGFVVAPYLRCGNNNGVSQDDFIEIQPGDSFDPYAHGWVGVNLSRGTFKLPGRYQAIFRYTTTERDPRAWVSGPCIDCRIPEGFYELLERVPAVDLVTSVEFDVKP